jgi:hypothetical protein
MENCKTLFSINSYGTYTRSNHCNLNGYCEFSTNISSVSTERNFLVSTERNFLDSVIKLAIDLGSVQFKIKINSIYFVQQEEKRDSSGQAIRLRQLTADPDFILQ